VSEPRIQPGDRVRWLDSSRVWHRPTSEVSNVGRVVYVADDGVATVEHGASRRRTEVSCDRLLVVEAGE
jgi:plastocyanin